MDGKMTLEQVRDKLRKHGVVAMTGNECFALADAIDAQLAQPAQAVDVVAIKVVIAELRARPFVAPFQEIADKLTRAIGNAQAEEWSVPEGWEIDVGEKSAAIRHRTGSKLVIKPERGNALLFDLLHQLAKSLPTPPTQATPNAHE